MVWCVLATKINQIQLIPILLLEFSVRGNTGTTILQAKNWPEKEAWKSDIMDAICSLDGGTTEGPVTTLAHSLVYCILYRRGLCLILLQSVSMITRDNMNVTPEKLKLTRSLSQAIEKPHEPPSPSTSPRPSETPFRSWLANASSTVRVKSEPVKEGGGFTSQLAELFTKQEKFEAPSVDTSQTRTHTLGRSTSYPYTLLRSH